MSTPSRPTRGRPASRSRTTGSAAGRTRGGVRDAGVAERGGSRDGGAPDRGASRDAGATERGRSRDGGVADRSRPRDAGAAERDRSRDGAATGRGRSRGTARAGGPGGRPERGGTGHGLDRLRVLLASTMGAVLAGYTMLVPVAALLTGTGGAPVTADGALAAAVPMWLAAHQIPIALDGHPLGVLPLLPTIVVVVLVGCFSRWAVRRLGGRVRHDAGAVVASQAGAAAAVAVLAGALLPREMAVTAPWASLVGAGLIGGTAAGVGVVHACGLPVAWRRVLAGWPGVALAGIRVAATGLLLTAALVLTAALLLTAPAVTDIALRLGPGMGAATGVLVLTVGYLPNALVGALSWTSGPGVTIGVATSGPLAAEPGPMPPFPLTAVLPVTAVPTAAPLVLLLPVAVGVLTGLACRRALPAGAPTADRIAAPVTAAAVSAVGAAVLATVAGGPLGGGPYDPVSFHPGALFGAVLLLVGLPALLTCAGPELARHVPMGSASGRRPAARPAPARSRGARQGRSATVGDLVERHRTSGSGAPGRASAATPAGRSTDDPDPGSATDHSTDHDSTDHDSTDHDSTDHDSTGQDSADHSATDRDSPDDDSADHSSADHSSADHSTTDRDSADDDSPDHSTTDGDSPDRDSPDHDR
ncbi:DUF6350 family protein [Pseudonocardia sp. NPDC046786]|uniref:cell division protein PerM n=1 Tax=Pseudonocardia sp. NPDC046786 TaxID=3155471 RepID=UPI0033D6766E